MFNTIIHAPTVNAVAVQIEANQIVEHRTNMILQEANIAVVKAEMHAEQVLNNEVNALQIQSQRWEAEQRLQLHTREQQATVELKAHDSERVVAEQRHIAEYEAFANRLYETELEKVRFQFSEQANAVEKSDDDKLQRITSEMKAASDAQQP